MSDTKFIVEEVIKSRQRSDLKQIATVKPPPDSANANLDRAPMSRTPKCSRSTDL